MFDPTPEQIEAAARALNPVAWETHDKLTDALGEFPREPLVKASLAQARAALVAAAGAAPQEQRERVEARLREVVYLCGDDIGCDCEEARLGAESLARELSIVAASEPTFTTSRVWALARALHDEAGDSDNVAAFAESLTASLRVAGIPFDELDFVDQGLLTEAEPAGAAPQEPVSARSSYISPSLPGRVRNLWKGDPSENSVRTVLNLAGDLIQELIDIRAALVQVDEAKLADVIWAEQSSRVLDGYVIHTRETAASTARAVAEWLRGGEQ